MRLIHGLAEYACKTPDTSALIHGQKRISYRKLEEVTSSLAQKMLDAGFRSGQRTAIYIEKSIDAVVAMIATLKAGGIYVPIDRNQPLERVSYILQNCEVSLLFASCMSESKSLSTMEQRLHFPETLENIIWLEESESGLSRFRRDTYKADKIGEPCRENLVFALYTSGSTGVPKGVKISEQNAQVFIDWCLQELKLDDTDRFLNVAGFHFDLSVFDIYATLSVGGTLVIFPELSIPNPFQICQSIEQHKITVLYVVPSLLVLMMSTGATGKYCLDSLKYLIFAGEVFPIKYLKLYQKMLPQAQFYNFYGPTETNVCSFYKVGKIPDSQTTPVPIGVAVSGARLYALNDNGLPIEKEEKGELYVSGPCVTPGYWNYLDPRNCENHLHHIHATGDLVSWQDGNFIFHGRKDNQIKLRGFRIELDEIETVLINHSSVKECAVVLDNREENQNLVAFVADKKGDLHSLLLKEYCAEHLPPHMIPKHFKILPDLPKNSNGKINKAYLRELLKQK